MRKIFGLAIVMAVAFGVMANKVSALDDQRQLIKVDEQLRASVLKEMRDLTEKLDEVLEALSEGDFKKVTQLGEIHLGFGHSKLEAMIASGASMEQVMARKQRQRQNRAAREKAGISGHRSGGNLFGIPAESGGLGQKLPEDFWLMGQAMHGAAEEMAVTARAASDQPTVENYQAVLGKLQEMTTSCKGCHNAYRIQ